MDLSIASQPSLVDVGRGELRAVGTSMQSLVRKVEARDDAGAATDAETGADHLMRGLQALATAGVVDAKLGTALRGVQKDIMAIDGMITYIPFLKVRDITDPAVGGVEGAQRGRIATQAAKVLRDLDAIVATLPQA